MKTIRWGIIGCGDVTEVKSGPAFNRCTGSQLVAVMRRTPDKAADYARRHQVPAWYDEADALLADPQVDAVYIATPPDSHADYTCRAAAAGKPVYVEKPMARTHAECQQMIAACQQAGVPLFVAYYRRCLPAFLKVKELLESGAIGPVRFVRVDLHYPLQAGDGDPDHLSWRVQPEQSGGGYFYDLASHQLDFLDYLLGPISQVQGQTANQAGLYPAEDLVVAHFAFASGVLGAGSWCFTVDPAQKIDRIELVGAAGKISFATFDFGPVLLETATGVQRFDLPVPQHVQQPLIQTVVDALRGLGPCPSTGESAARTARVMDRITAA
ncbi:MAG: gfo/Idh/MocA family oxidoreductase [Candidatus Latescibacteria bacterium]|nr:gfo/Idh/MocA family oxidoreductase [Candidatus Latescibacterota bacterium]